MDFNQQDTHSERFKEPNMVPLIDVMMVLLVIVLITSPLLNQVIQVEVAGNEQIRQANLSPLKLTISKQGLITFQGNLVSEAELKTLLSSAVQSNPDIELRISAEQQTPYQDVLKIMSVLNDLEISKIQFHESQYIE